MTFLEYKFGGGSNAPLYFYPIRIPESRIRNY
jgi:hypothetical protein